MKRVRTVFTVCLLFMILLSSFPASSNTQKKTSQNEQSCHLTIGVVPQFQQRHIFKIWHTVLDALETKTHCHFELVSSSTITDFETSFKDGLFDLAYMNPYHAVIAHKAQGYEPLVRSGAKKLTGILVVKKDNNIQDIRELAGKEVAFPSPNALGASLLMRAELAYKHDTTVIPKYVKTHSSVYLHVAKGLVEAGGGVARTLSQQPDEVKDLLRVFYTTAPVNAHPLVAHPRIGKDRMNTIQQAWLDLAKEQPGLFDNIPMKAPVASSHDDYTELETLGLEKFVSIKE